MKHLERTEIINSYHKSISMIIVRDSDMFLPFKYTYKHKTFKNNVKN